MNMEEMSSINQNYVLVVDSNGNMDILQVSYETKWEDLCIMLQLKFEHEEIPKFTYTDDEEDYVCLDCQEALEEAMKISRKNSDVLHIQIRDKDAPPLKPQRPSSQTSSYNAINIPVDRARLAVGNTVNWVKSTLFRNLSSDYSSQEAQANQVIDVDEREGNANTSLNGDAAADGEPCLHNSLQNQTSVKEPFYSGSCDISVPTSSISEAEPEISVKLPIQSNLQPDEVIKMETSVVEKIKEEVRLAITKELLTLREEITAGLKQNNDVQIKDEPCTSSDVKLDRPRSPTQIKADMKKLRQEMKEAKEIKKAQKQFEKAALKNLQTQTQKEKPSKVRKYAACFICENLLDGSCISVGQQFVKYWVLKNEGTVTWDHRIELKLIDENCTDNSSPVDPKLDENDSSDDSILQLESGRRWGPEKNSVAMPIVESGKTAVIAISHIAPIFPCVYTSAWRLCHRNKFFGPRIWCKVSVNKSLEMQTEASIDQAFSSSEPNHSFVSKSWVSNQKLPVNDEMLEDGDELENMFSFEMTAVAACEPENVFQNEEDTVIQENPEPISILELHSENLVENEEITTAQSEPKDCDELPPSDEPEEQKIDCQDVEEQEAFDDVTNDASSDVASDFEVIPIPECFDTSKPLVEKLDNIDEESSSRASITKGNFKKTDENESEVCDESHINDENDDQPRKPSEHQPFLPSSLPVTSSAPGIAFTSLPSIPCARVTPRIPIGETSTSQSSTINQTEIPQENVASTSQPVPLPRGASESEKQKLKRESEIAPSPHPRSSAASTSSQFSQLQISNSPNIVAFQEQFGENDNVEEIQPARATSINNRNLFDQSSVINSPAIEVYEEEEEFALAPEVPVAQAPEVPVVQTPEIPVAQAHAPPVNRIPAIPEAPAHQDHDPSPLEQLVDMGFYHIELNERLLNKYCNDLNKVVNELVLRSTQADHQPRLNETVQRADGSYIA